MITFKRFLEASTSPYTHQAQGIDELTRSIEKHCGRYIEALNMDGTHQIWRGSKSSKPSGIFDPSSGERRSQNTSNQYTVLLDSNPVNKDWPLRSRSFIASTSKVGARDFAETGPDSDGVGTLYACFPFDGVKVGVVNEDDLWNVRVNFNGGFNYETALPRLNSLLRAIFKRSGQDTNWTPTLAQLTTFLKKSVYPEDFLAVADNNFGGNDISADELLSSFIEQLPTIYSFKHLGCELTTPDKLSNDNSEVWFSGRCVMVTEADWKEVSQNL